jgi:hypothetical protein
MNPGTMQDPAKPVDAAIGLERMAQAAEIAGVVSCFAGDGAHLTATTILADGGVKQGSVGL